MTADTALLIDFGSTYTKLRAIDLDAGKIPVSYTHLTLPTIYSV